MGQVDFESTAMCSSNSSDLGGTGIHRLGLGGPDGHPVFLIRRGGAGRASEVLG